MSTNYTDLLYKEEKGIATITINRPKVLNAFSAHTVEELIQAFLKAGWNKKIGVIVLTGTGDRAFCTGGDQSAHVGQYERPRHQRPARRGAAIADPRRAQAGDRARARLRDRRRQCARDPVRPHDRFRQGDLRPGRPERGLGRSGLRHRLPRARRRREEGARDLVPVPPLHGPGGARDGLVQRRGAARPARRRGRASGARSCWPRARPRSPSPSARSMPTARTSAASARSASRRSRSTTTPRSPERAPRPSARSASPTSAPR